MTKKHLNGPFVLPVRDLVHRPGEMRELAFDVDAPEKWGEGLAFVPAAEPIALEVRLESVHEGILVTADARTRYSAECGRCLTAFDAPVEVEFQELFGYSGDEATDFEVQDDHVDLETCVRDSIVLSLPFQPVCEPDCLGLDPVTGQKLSTDAAVEQEEPIDPRWATLKAYTPDHDGAHTRADDTEKS